MSDRKGERRSYFLPQARIDALNNKLFELNAMGYDLQISQSDSAVIRNEKIFCVEIWPVSAYVARLLDEAIFQRTDVSLN